MIFSIVINILSVILITFLIGVIVYRLFRICDNKYKKGEEIIHIILSVIGLTFVIIIRFVCIGFING